MNVAEFRVAIEQVPGDDTGNAVADAFLDGNGAEANQPVECSFQFYSHSENTADRSGPFLDIALPFRAYSPHRITETRASS